MELERLSLAVRPRNAWEAMDLGFRMVRVWWRAVYAPLLALMLPLLVVLHLAFRESPWMAGVALWWLKPLYDRLVLHVLSRAVFGAAPDTRATLRALPGLLATGLLADLSWRRLGVSRSFRLPVSQLEGLRGEARRSRVRTLDVRTRGHAQWLTVVCLHLESFLYLGFIGLLALMVPQSIALDPWQLLSDEAGVWQESAANLLYFAALVVMEPMYVAAGFALYLNRRTLLEGWDIEIGFRRMAARLASDGALAAGVVLLAVLATLLPAPPAAAKVEPAPVAVPARPATDIEKVVREVLADPVFGAKQTRTTWRPRARGEADDAGPGLDFGLLGRVGAFLARAAEVAMWVGLAVLLAVGVLNAQPWLARWRARARGSARHARPPPRTVAGLDVRPQSLPPDVGAAAWAQWQDGERRLALSLLYRAALSVLIEYQLPLSESHTEGEVLALARALPDATGRAYFPSLTRAWQRIAYAHRAPDSDEVRALCRAWADWRGGLV